MELKEQMYEYLNDKFGEGFTDLIELPREVKIGERVLYLLNPGHTVSRKEFEQAAIDEHQEMLEDIVKKTGGFLAPTELPVESGLPDPRTVDILDWSDVAMDIPAKEYLLSDNLSPKEDYSIDWLFGLVFWHSSKQLVYIDFTHPKVKTVLSMEYDSEYQWTLGKNMYSNLAAFIQKRKDLIADIEARAGDGWTKLLQLNDTVFIQLKNL